MLLPEQGIVFKQMEHTTRSVFAPKEIDRVEKIVDAPLESNYTINKKGITKEGLIDSSKILIIALFNVQVNKLEKRLQGRERVGTVDRLHGQEAPVFIFSFSSGSGDEAPKRINFLLEEKPVNVAMSRAQCLVLDTASSNLSATTANKNDEAKQLSKLAKINIEQKKYSLNKAQKQEAQ